LILQGATQHSRDKKNRSNARKRKSTGKKKTVDEEDDDAELASKLQKMEWLASRTTRSNNKSNKDSSKKEKDKEPCALKHCLGPGCVNAARQGSKYCSHECGVQLQIR